MTDIKTSQSMLDTNKSLHYWQLSALYISNCFIVVIYQVFFAKIEIILVQSSNLIKWSNNVYYMTTFGAASYDKKVARATL